MFCLGVRTATYPRGLLSRGTSLINMNASGGKGEGGQGTRHVYKSRVMQGSSNNSVFLCPQEFKYDRFVDAKFYKNGKELKHPIIAFGSLCPGKKYSLLQTKWFMLNLINSFEMELLDGESTLPDVNFYGHEILPPVHDVQVRYRLLENSHELDLVSKRTC